MKEKALIIEIRSTGEDEGFICCVEDANDETLEVRIQICAYGAYLINRVFLNHQLRVAKKCSKWFAIYS